MKKWSLFLILILLFFSSIYYLRFKKSDSSPIENLEQQSTKAQVQEKPKVQVVETIEDAEPPLTEEPLTNEECLNFAQDTIYQYIKTSFYCFTFDYWASFDVGNQDLSLTMKFDPQEYLPSFGRETSIEIDFRVESSNKELTDFNQEFAHTFPANLKKFKLSYENPTILDFIYNRLNLDKEKKSEILVRNFTAYKEYCRHREDQEQYLIQDVQWTSMNHQGVIKIPKRSNYYRIKYEGGTKQTAKCQKI